MPNFQITRCEYCFEIWGLFYENDWYLLRSYFFKARSETQFQFKKKEGTRKYWEEVKYKKIKIFEACNFSEIDIQKFLFIDKLNYKTLEEIYKYSQELGIELMPRDVSLALRGIDKSKDHIKERAGFLIGSRKVFQGALIDGRLKVTRHCGPQNKA